MFHSLFPKMQIKNETAVPIHNCQVKAIFVHDTGKPKSSTIYACWRRVVIKPAIKFLLKKKSDIDGPFAADTIFMKEQLRKYDVIIGMYHDQVLTPMKALFNFDAINITLGLPFIRVSPDHGPNTSMLGKNKSNPQSLIEALKFLDN